MHPTVYDEFRSIVSAISPSGRCLEVGAIASQASLLAMDEIRHMERIGINLAPPGKFRDFEVITLNANDMNIFPGEHFDLVMCNALLEHDRYFWQTVPEIRRVLKPGGVAIIGTPGFADSANTGKFTLPPGWEGDEKKECWRDSTLTLRFHGAPNDYWRFSESAVKDVFFDGYRDIHVRVIMVPPRIIGYGAKA